LFHHSHKPYTMETREQILKALQEQYNEQFAGDGYPDEFKPQGAITQCNFGGLLVILHNSGDSLVVWSDWADNAISHELTECEIDYKEDPDNDVDFDLQAYFTYQETDYFLHECFRIN